MQKRDPYIQEIQAFLKDGTLPVDEKKARKLVLQAPLFTVLDKVLYFIDQTKDGAKRIVVSTSLRRHIMEEHHSGIYGGHFSGPRTINQLARCWWWQGMYIDVCAYCKACPECVISTGGSRPGKPPPLSYPSPTTISNSGC